MARSRAATEVTSRRPTPGQANMDSVMSDPLISPPILNPRTVTTGIAALGMACHAMRLSQGTPLAREVRI